MTNSANSIQSEVKVKGQKLGTVTSDTLEKLVQMMALNHRFLKGCTSHCSLAKMKPICGDNNISLGQKVKPLFTLVISLFLFASESWTLTPELEKRTQAIGMRCYRRLLKISYKDHVTNEEVRRKIQQPLETMMNS